MEGGHIARKVVSSEVDSFQAWKTLVCVFILNTNTLGALKIHSLIYDKIVNMDQAGIGFYDQQDLISANYNVSTGALISEHPHQANNIRQLASWPIATATTFQLLAGPLTPLLATKFSWRSIELLQTFLLVLSYVSAYLSRSLIIDVLTLGILQGVALSMRYNMNVVINNEYFDKYRTTAMGFALAGSTSGVLFLKPTIQFVLDTYGIRNAYLALAMIVSVNFALNLLIRPPKVSILHQVTDKQSDISIKTYETIVENRSRHDSINQTSDSEILGLSELVKLFKNPATHYIWILQTIYFYNNRTYTIFIVDYGTEKGLERQASRNLLSFWIYGEIAGRLLLGRLIDTRILSTKYNVALVNFLLGFLGLSLMLNVSMDPNLYFVYIGIILASIAAGTSLVNMVIIPCAQETIGHENVAWAYASCSVITGVFMFTRPYLVGFSKDYLGSYSLLIVVMSSVPIVFAAVFLIIESLLARHRRIE